MTKRVVKHHSKLVAHAAVVEAQTVLTERELMDNLRSEAKKCGWLVYHPFLSKWSEKGFPDLIMIRSGKGFAWELKSAKGRVTDAQQTWIDALRGIPGVSARVVYPDDLEKAYQALVTGEWKE